MKPKHRGGYTNVHAELCERTLVTLLRGLGPYRDSIYLIGGLVPRYLIDHSPDDASPAHLGTTDVDLVLDVSLVAKVEAYRKLEQNLKELGFQRGTNDAGQPQHYSWRKPVGANGVIVVDLLCDAPPEQGGEVITLPGERRLSALKIPGAHLAVNDHVNIDITAELLDERGVVTQTVQVANIVPFIVLKVLAFKDRIEEKDAYDLVYCLRFYRDGPEDVAQAFADAMQAPTVDHLVFEAVEIIRSHFATDAQINGNRKDGPVSYARFITDPGKPNQDAIHRQDAVAAAEAFLNHLDRLIGRSLA